uniref:Uncharacterized protein n=1 Tax=Arundo donax TaxID=35708 RepID=A0A0A9GNZ9_ARUDO
MFKSYFRSVSEAWGISFGGSQRCFAVLIYSNIAEPAPGLGSRIFLKKLEVEAL